MPHITSYDYDAIINEQGSPTKKYYLIRNLMKKYLNSPIDVPPAVLNSILIPPFKPSNIKSYLFANLPEATIKNGKLTYFESDLLKMYDQGMVLY